MSEPFLAEIRIVGFDFAPRGNAFCDGQILPINQNQSLYSLLGTTYGGDGRTTFALPDLQGRVPIHPDSSNPLGRKAGTETHTLAQAEMPSHSHSAPAITNQASANSPAGHSLARKPRRAPDFYTVPATTPDMKLNAGTVATFGGGQAHNNMQPYLAVNYVIALQGLFPSRN